MIFILTEARTCINPHVPYIPLFFTLMSITTLKSSHKTMTPEIKKFEIKYGCEGFEICNNFHIGTSLDSNWILNKK
jgi:hypothetical protein